MRIKSEQIVSDQICANYRNKKTTNYYYYFLFLTWDHYN